MDVRPAPTPERLARAGRLAASAAEAGAHMVVLPELFNTGYVYAQETLARAEPVSGITLDWMKLTAYHHRIHLAGSLLAQENFEIYNAMFIVAPDGKTWRYDKTYPWAWERGYFRPARAGSGQNAVAHTELGDLGMLICWDVAHPNLWQRYAGQVDMLVICSSPPLPDDLTFWLPDGSCLTGSQIGRLGWLIKGEANRVFGIMLAEQAGWLGIPTANSAACGMLDSPVPNAAACLLSVALARPGLLRNLPQAGLIRMTAPMVDTCRIISQMGETLGHRPQAGGEGFVMAKVDLPEQRFQPPGPQPVSRVSRLSYFLSDWLLPALMLPVYRKGIKEAQALVLSTSSKKSG
jgi:hypothetical protein